MQTPSAFVSTASRHRGIEWPTLAVAGVIYGGFLGLTFWHDALSWWIVGPLCAWLVAWHGSLQHEILHGHPTRSRLLNKALASVPLSLWLPYESYRRSHLRHHFDERLTDPLDDPESRYLTVGDWQRVGPLSRRLLSFQKTFVGRLIIGPGWAVGHFWAAEARRLRRGEPGALRGWVEHGLGVGAVAFWLVAVCGIDLFSYILFVVYPSVSLLLIRSFAEHKAADGVAERTAVVENAPLLGLLYLHNNLHAAHHERPTMPWYDIPAWYADNRERLLHENGGHVYDGYFDVARRYFLTSHDSVVHPRGERADAPVDDLGYFTSDRSSVRNSSI